jgi:L-fucose mutarotase
MLKGIPYILPPKLMKIMMEMGHGDELVIADRNFPARALAKRYVRSDVTEIPMILTEILKLFPLDEAVPCSVILMAVTPGVDFIPTLDGKYTEIVKQHSDTAVTKIDKQSFYDRSKDAYAVLQTGESERFANIIIRKGLITQ